MFLLDVLSNSCFWTNHAAEWTFHSDMGTQMLFHACNLLAANVAFSFRAILKHVSFEQSSGETFIPTVFATKWPMIQRLRFNVFTKITFICEGSLTEITNILEIFLSIVIKIIVRSERAAIWKRRSALVTGERTNLAQNYCCWWK